MAADGPKLIEVTLGSAATARCRTATSCALSGAHSSTRPVRGELGSAPRPAASEHERSPMLVTLRSEENVYVLSQPLAQLAGSVGETRCLRWQCLVRIPSERGQTKASTRNCERKPTTRRATGARKSGRKVVTVDPMHTKAQTCNSNLIRGPYSSSGRGPVRSRRLLNLRKSVRLPLKIALAGLLLSW